MATGREILAADNARIAREMARKHMEAGGKRPSGYCIFKGRPVLYWLPDDEGRDDVSADDRGSAGAESGGS